MILCTAAGRRPLAEEEFPLALLPPARETRDTAEPRLIPHGILPSAAAPVEPVAWIGLDDGEAFLQPVPGSSYPLKVNGLRLTASRWLRSGDTLTLNWPDAAGGASAGGVEVRRHGPGGPLALETASGTPAPEGWEPVARQAPAEPPASQGQEAAPGTVRATSSSHSSSSTVRPSPDRLTTVEPRSFSPRRLREMERRRGWLQVVLGMAMVLSLATALYLGWPFLESYVETIRSLDRDEPRTTTSEESSPEGAAEPEPESESREMEPSPPPEPPEDPRSSSTLAEAPSAPPTPTSVTLLLDSSPPGATVTREGDYLGVTPVTLELPEAGPVPLTLSRAGYLPLERTLSREDVPDTADGATVTVELTPEMGTVTVSLEPGDARLLVDGGESPAPDRAEAGGAGPSVRTLELTTEPHTLRADRPGFTPVELTVLPIPGEPQEVRIALEAASESGAAVAREDAPARLESPEGHGLIRIEAGRFQMGASRREPGRRANEVLRQVALSRPFYLASRVVTNQQMRRFDPDHRSGRAGPYNLEIDHHPAVNMSWEAAALYCNWLSAQEGLPPAYLRAGGTLVPVVPATTGYRLPTEAEWSWAARYGPGGEGPKKYPWGNSLPVPDGAGNFADAPGLLPTVLPGYRDGHPVTAPPDAFGPDARGLHQMGGNVAEWVQDVYSIRPPEAHGAVAVDPTGPAAGDLHVIRGAGWRTGNVTQLRLTYRDYGSEGRPDVGFRVARTLTPSSSTSSPETVFPETASPENTAPGDTPP